MSDFIQAVLQGSFILAKAKQGPEVVRENLEHLRSTLRVLFQPDAHSQPKKKKRHPPATRPEPVEAPEANSKWRRSTTASENHFVQLRPRPHSAMLAPCPAKIAAQALLRQSLARGIEYHLDLGLAVAEATNAASNWLGGNQTPASIMRWWKRAKASLSEALAEAKSVTGPAVKNQMNIEPTRLAVSGTPACAPLLQLPPQCFASRVRACG